MNPYKLNLLLFLLLTHLVHLDFVEDGGDDTEGGDSGLVQANTEQRLPRICMTLDCLGLVVVFSEDQTTMFKKNVFHHRTRAENYFYPEEVLAKN